MNKTIWKFPVNDLLDNQIGLPEGAEILDIQVQNDMPVMWALVNPEAPKKNLLFRVFATGEKMLSPERWKYVGTFQKGWFVGHVFEWVNT